ncbi:MAG: phosphoenolpyruvate--protein phosphotransferase [Planctomycetota bacterium]
MSKEITATTASPGIAIGQVLHLRSSGEFVPTRKILEQDVVAELERFRGAMGRAKDALLGLIERLAAKIASRDTDIYRAQVALLEDPGFVRDVEALIADDRINAEVALQRVVAKYEEAFESIDNAAIRQRASDIRDVGRQVLQVLLQREQEALQSKDEGVILAVDEFLPSDIGKIDTDKVVGILMGEGGRYSHGAILAKSLGIPCLVGLERNLRKVPAGTPVILDGDGGKLVIDPEEEELELFTERKKERTEADNRVWELRLSPSVTLDEERIRLYANLEGLRDLDMVGEGIFEGVGLFRTEFVFMERLQFPSEEEQLVLYRTVLEKVGGKRVTFRTLDIGGDKPLTYFRTPKERNPVLGWRGIRVTLQWQDLFYTQIRALVRASSAGPVSILLPMVTTIEELRKARRIVHEVVDDLRAKGEPIAKDIRFGVMIEVPGLAMVLPAVFNEVDFISVGSNDLVQYLLAVDRDNQRVSGLYDPFHPGVLAFLAQIAQLAREAGKSCAICGEVAGDSQLVPLLLGMGFRQFSMAPVFLPRIKLAARSVSVKECEELFASVSTLATAEEVYEAVRAWTRKRKM